MSHNIVLLNLGDRAKGGGLIAKTAASLRKKYPVKKRSLFSGNQIDELSLFNLLDKYEKRGNSLPLSDPDLQVIRTRCSSASKIMLCMHGLHNDVDSGFANDSFGGTPMAAVADPVDLAHLMLYMLPARKKVYDVALVMCYGARSQNFRLDHTGMIAIGDLQTSFAYKFYKRVCIARSIRMTARTGALGFDSTSGRSTVESEAAVNARADKDELLRLSTTQQAIDNYIALKDTYTKAAMGGSQDRAKQWIVLDEKFRKNPDTPPLGADEQTVAEYRKIVRSKDEFQTIMSAGDTFKFGKFVYTYEEQKRMLNIFSKYPEPGVQLYAGPLV